MKETIIILAIVALGAWMLWRVWQGNRAFQFRSKPILTGSDLDFFRRLQAALPECCVLTQVAMSALMEPMDAGKAWQTAFKHIASKRVDYAIFDAEMVLLAVVELGHLSQASRKEVRRDQLLASAGIKIVRFHARQLPSTMNIQQSIIAPAEWASRSRLSHFPNHSFARENHADTPLSSILS